MSWEGDGQAGSLHGGLVVPQLMDPLLLQQQGLLLITFRNRKMSPLISHFRTFPPISLYTIHNSDFNRGGITDDFVTRKTHLI